MRPSVSKLAPLSVHSSFGGDRGAIIAWAAGPCSKSMAVLIRGNVSKLVFLSRNERVINQLCLNKYLSIVSCVLGQGRRCKGDGVQWNKGELPFYILHTQLAFYILHTHTPILHTKYPFSHNTFCTSILPFYALHTHTPIQYSPYPYSQFTYYMPILLFYIPIPHTRYFSTNPI